MRYHLKSTLFTPVIVYINCWIFLFSVFLKQGIRAAQNKIKYNKAINLFGFFIGHFLPSQTSILSIQSVGWERLCPMRTKLRGCSRGKQGEEMTGVKHKEDERGPTCPFHALLQHWNLCTSWPRPLLATRTHTAAGLTLYPSRLCGKRCPPCWQWGGRGNQPCVTFPKGQGQDTGCVK